MIDFPEYFSPEQISGKSYDFGIEIWQLGNLLFEMSQGFPPF